MLKTEQAVGPSPHVRPDYRHSDPNWVYPPEPPAIPLSRYLRVVNGQRWKIFGFVSAALIVTGVISALMSPVYESTATVEIDPAGIGDPAPFFATQISLAKTEAVLRPVIEQYSIGQDARAFLLNLRVTRSPGANLFLIGYRSPDRQRAADVTNAIARSYQLYRLSRDFQKHVDGLRANVSAHFRQLDADLAQARTDRVAKEAAWRSVQDGASEATAVLGQGEALKRIAESLNDAHMHDRVSQPDYASATARLAEMQHQFQNARETLAKRAEVEYRDALSVESNVQKLLSENKAESDHLSALSLDYDALIRQALADPKMHAELIRRIKEAGINVGFLSSRVAIVNDAHPSQDPVSPNLQRNLFAAFFFSTLFAAGAALLGDALHNTEPDRVEALPYPEAAGTVPQTKKS